MIDRDGLYTPATSCRVDGCPGKPILNGSCKDHWRDVTVPQERIRMDSRDERFMLEALGRHRVPIQ